MAIKKTELYSRLWKLCDDLRGGMDASQYKDYILVLLFIKYVSDMYKSGNPFSSIKVPEGGSFDDMVAAKGKKDIGDQINKIVANLAEANDLRGVIDQCDFNDESKLGKGKEMQERLTSLIAIFEDKDLDFRKNKAEGDDILGDAYEYLMRHFATESGKSKGQFYTPAEVSRIMAKVIGVDNATHQDETIYDPTCGSGSLLLKAADEAPEKIDVSGEWKKLKLTLYGQEKDQATRALAKMNMILHSHPAAAIKQGNTLADPLFIDSDGTLKTFDFVVANPPFSDKKWQHGVNIADDPYQRFSMGVPPAKNGDYAYLSHFIRSMKATGHGAIILPHGVLFRGNSEATIRKEIINKGFIKGIIGLPANLFYGTGIPACIIVLDKKTANTRKGVFMIDASKGYMKDGPKNRLRHQDIHKIVDVFLKQTELSKYSRFVPLEEIRNNDYNLNIPRYIDSSAPEDIQCIEAHLKGGIPNADIDALGDYWSVFPSVRTALFAAHEREGFCQLRASQEDIRKVILEDAGFIRYSYLVRDTFTAWQLVQTSIFKALQVGGKPKETINTAADALLEVFLPDPLIDRYDMYQRLMVYWDDVMQDDMHMIVVDGWKPNTDLVPYDLVIARYFPKEKQEIDDLEAARDEFLRQKDELAEEHGGDEGILDKVGGKGEAREKLLETIELACESIAPALCRRLQRAGTQLEVCEKRQAELLLHPLVLGLRNSKGNVTQEAVKARIKSSNDPQETGTLKQYLAAIQESKNAKSRLQELQKKAYLLVMKYKDKHPDGEDMRDIDLLQRFLYLLDVITKTNKELKAANDALQEKLLAFYPTLTEEQVKQLVVDDKWMATLHTNFLGELDRVSQALAARVKQLAQRYESTLPELETKVTALTAEVEKHLQKMGYSWK